jgi:hypothetical protein
MSEIKVDTLTGKTTANDITVTVGATATQSLQQGLAKSWITSVDNGASISDSLNVSSTADTAAGRQKVAITNAFASQATMCCAASGRNTTNDNGSGNTNRTCDAVRGASASEVFLNSYIMNDGSLVDVALSQYHATGDLA